MHDEGLRAEPVSGLIAQARGLLGVRRFEQAVVLLQRAIGADPLHYEARCLLANTFYRMGDDRAAVQAAENAAATNPAAAWPHYQRALALLHMKQRRPGLTAALEAVRLEPESADALSVLVTAQLECGHWRAARVTAEQLLAVAPEEARTHERVGAIALKRARWKAAEAAFRRALALDPESLTALVNLGVTLQHLMRTQEAVDIIHAAAQLAPDDPWIQAHLFRAVSAHQEQRPLLPTLLFTAGYLACAPLVVVNVAAGLVTVVLVVGLDLADRRRRLNMLPASVVTFFELAGKTFSRRRTTRRQWGILAAVLGVIAGIVGAIVAANPPSGM